MIKVNKRLYDVLSKRHVCINQDGSVIEIGKHTLDKYCYYYITKQDQTYTINNLDIYNNREIPENKFVYPTFSSVYLSDEFFSDNELLIDRMLKNNYKYNANISEINIYKKINYINAKSLVDAQSDVVIYKYTNINYAKSNGIKTETLDDGTTVSYIEIDNYISTNTLSYNIANELYDNLDIDTINEFEINGNLNESQFKLIYPFMKNDIFLDVVYHLKEWIILPTNIKLLVKYTYTYLNDENTTQLVNNNFKQYVYLNRYFGNIMPSFINVSSNISDMYKEIFKIDGLNFTNTQYLSYVHENCNIYQHEKIYYIKEYDNLKNRFFYAVAPTETKHFNNNIIYHLPSTITITADKIVRYEDIEKYEDENKIFEIFTNHVKNHYFNSIDLQSLLFLFNKYAYTCEKNVVKYDLQLKIRLYSIVYQFVLK